MLVGTIKNGIVIVQRKTSNMATATVDVNTVYTWDEIKKHTTRDNGVWIVIKGLVYNVTAFMLEHPGGGTFPHYYACSGSFTKKAW